MDIYVCIHICIHICIWKLQRSFVCFKIQKCLSQRPGKHLWNANIKGENTPIFQFLWLALSCETTSYPIRYERFLIGLIFLWIKPLTSTWLLQLPGGPRMNCVSSKLSPLTWRISYC